MAIQAAEGLLSPYLKEQRVSAVLPFLNGKVLDVGCGNGALANYVSSENYVGIDIDEDSIRAARANHPQHTFVQTLQVEADNFDTIVGLAVIEHVSDPVLFLANLKKNLNNHSDARIICSTPHPAMDWVHWLGSRIGLFSHSANDEHEDLLGKRRLRQVGAEAGLKLVQYKRFLFGANQLATYARDAI